MKDNLIARQLRRLGLAYEIQKVANPILKRGATSQTSIYYNEILKKFAVCENTFRSLVKLKEAENYPTLLAEYRNRQKARYQARLERQRKKRIKQKYRFAAARRISEQASRKNISPILCHHFDIAGDAGRKIAAWRG